MINKGYTKKPASAAVTQAVKGFTDNPFLKKKPHGDTAAARVNNGPNTGTKPVGGQEPNGNPSK